MIPQEQWLPVPGFEELYEVSDMGNVRSKRGVLTARQDTKGYALVSLSKEGIVRHYGIHHLVALAFIPNPLKLPNVTHIDNLRQHNAVANLKWIDNVGTKRFYGVNKYAYSRSAKK